MICVWTRDSKYFQIFEREEKMTIIIFIIAVWLKFKDMYCLYYDFFQHKDVLMGLIEVKISITLIFEEKTFVKSLYSSQSYSSFIQMCNCNPLLSLQLSNNNSNFKKKTSTIVNKFMMI